MILENLKLYTKNAENLQHMSEYVARRIRGRFHAPCYSTCSRCTTCIPLHIPGRESLLSEDLRIKGKEAAPAWYACAQECGLKWSDSPMVLIASREAQVSRSEQLL